MLRHLPIVLGVVLIVGLTIVEATMSDRFQGSNITAERFSELLSAVPLQVGDWQGEDLTVEDVVRQTAGAIGYVSRAYRNVNTNETVTVWLIVGHARDICRHTPNVCYASSGFRVRAEHNAVHPIDVQGLPPAQFLTNTFLKEDATGRQLVRVFWAWYEPQPDGEVLWKAPKNPRWKFGNARALFKLYLIDEMRDPKDTADRSACIRFAQEFLPLIDKALSGVESSPSDNSDAAPPDA